MNRETADRETDRLTGSSIPFEGPFSLSGDAHLQGQKYKAAVTTGTTDTINSQMEEGVAITLQRKKSQSVLPCTQQGVHSVLLVASSPVPA